METNESNLKPQPTGGLKLMTVFIAVLALHVVVIGGFTVWHLLNPAPVDGDLALDKNHKGKIVSDSSVADLQPADAAASDKLSPPATDNTTEPATATTETANTPAPAATPAAPVTPTATAGTMTTTPTQPATPTVITPQTPPTMAEDASSTAANPPTDKTSSGPIHHGPVVTPPDNFAPPADSTAASVASDTTAPVADGTSYTVKRGDSLAKIARHHHVALAKLRTANSLASNALHIGQKLVIPNRAQKTAPADATATAAAAPATTPATADTETAADATAPAPATSITEPSVATMATPKHTHKVAAVHHLYTVVKGDTLTKIAKRYHITTSAIIAANGIANAGRLSIGQKLHIPSHETRAAATASQEATPEEVSPRQAAKGQLANYMQ